MLELHVSHADPFGSKGALDSAFGPELGESAVKFRLSR
jgi:hypothetical protein